MSIKNNLIFLHIPKNGGTTFDSILDKTYPSQNTFSIQPIDNDTLNINEFTNLSVSQREQIHLLKGHMIFGLHKFLVGPTDYITFLRNPEDRIISYYFYAKNLPSHRLFNRIKNEKMSLYDFVTKVDDGDINNAQINVIGGGKDKEEIMLEKAIQNIETHFSFVGLLERFNESLILLKKKQLLNNPYYQSLNKTSKRIQSIDLDNRTKMAIAEMNKGDNVIYEMAQENFNLEIARVNNLKLELFKLNTHNKLFSLYSNNIPNSVKLKIKKLLLKDN
jgi:Sulfotransferase family